MAKALKEVIQSIIEDAFNRIEYAYLHHQVIKPDVIINNKTAIPTHLIFPKYRGKDVTRVSEQELRFAFVEAFNAYCNKMDNKDKLDLFYSIETPTQEKYSFSDGEPKVIREEKGGRSAEFDLVVFDKNLKRVCLIEFKAKSVKPANYQKDIIKLIEDKKDKNGTKEDGVLSFFINLFESSDAGTINTMKEKIKEFIKNNNYMNEEDVVIGYYVLGTSERSFKPLKDISFL